MDDVRLRSRFQARVRKSLDGHHYWTGRTDKWGYGLLDVMIDGKNRPVKAHRVAWYLARGEWPEQTIDHLCYAPGCVRLSHLEDVSQSVNSKRMAAKFGNWNTRKTHCKRGHEFTEENTRVSRRGDGRVFRTCRKCVLLDTHKRRGPEPTRHSGPRRTEPNWDALDALSDD